MAHTSVHQKYFSSPQPPYTVVTKLLSYTYVHSRAQHIDPSSTFLSKQRSEFPQHEHTPFTLSSLLRYYRLGNWPGPPEKDYCSSKEESNLVHQPVLYCLTDYRLSAFSEQVIRYILDTETQGNKIITSTQVAS